MDTQSKLPAGEYVFTATQDWSSYHRNAWATLFPLVKSSSPRILEVGSWEGRSAVFFLEGLGGEITCVDHFDLMQTPAGRERYATMTHNLSLTNRPFRIVDDFSTPGMMTLLEEAMSSENAGFDWIHIDGSHEGDDTFLDGELAWRMARKGAILIFDDYHWKKEPEESIHHPKRGIDAFMALHAGEYEKLSDSYQMILQKTSDMRIGFLAKGKDFKGELMEVLGSRAAHPMQYDEMMRAEQNVNRVEQKVNGNALIHSLREISVVLALDSKSAMPAAVTIRSLVEHAHDPITIYIVDCGLSPEDKKHIGESASTKGDVTLTFLALPEGGLVKELGANWGKVDALGILPVDRVIYLEAGLLVRASLNELWQADLRENAVGAVPDVRYPIGHPGMPQRAYFNAGVILLDLAGIRKNLPELKTLGRKMMNSKYAEQDALNENFALVWTPLDLVWNAQGLGTYAEDFSAARAVHDLARLKAPKIVHFTGPTVPTLPQVLDPSHQPYTEKPWSYAGAPDHPYAEEWWNVLEKTSWRGLRTSVEWRQSCDAERKKAIQDGINKFQMTVVENWAVVN